MLDGTNEIKSERKVKAPRNLIQGVADLKQALAHLAVGEQVSWAHRVEGFEFPPEDTRQEIEKSATDAKIKLRIRKQKD